ncbi:MAG: hypothetical protein IPH12_14105 [Saprospirales bacterium]|nr:hypothetical protein [Saprospirales bacterium]MBK8924090.1 hypothetical protein [Saprospirales bacterium]
MELNKYCIFLSKKDNSLDEVAAFLGGRQTPVGDFQVNVSEFSECFNTAVLVKQVGNSSVNHISLSLNLEVELETFKNYYGHCDKTSPELNADDEYIFYPDAYKNSACSIALIVTVQNNMINTVTIRPDCQ